MNDNYLSQGFIEFWIRFDSENKGKMLIDGVEYGFPALENWTDGNEWHKITIDLCGHTEEIDGEKLK